ncbi:MAG: hypothetical protein KBD76_11680 [Bacteriovorax sp.]|nr:hypothetical protein [Bacteriovorax sp.]
MKEEIATVNYIFYLQTRNELEEHFYVLADIFSKLNIKLLPISPNDLQEIDRSNKHHVIVVRNDLASGMSFNQVRKSFLDLAMLSGRISLFDVSSFSEVENGAKFQTKKTYRYFQLPQNLKQVAMEVAVDYFNEKNTLKEWPGGKRAKLPSMTNES